MSVAMSNECHADALIFSAETWPDVYHQKNRCVRHKCNAAGPSNAASSNNNTPDATRQRSATTARLPGIGHLQQNMRHHNGTICFTYDQTKTTQRLTK